MSVVPKGTPRTEAYRLVWEGRFTHTSGGLTKSDLSLNAQGRIVSKAMQANGQRRWHNMSATERRKFGHNPLDTLRANSRPRSSRKPVTQQQIRSRLSSRKPTPLAQLQARLALPPRRPATLCTATPVGTVCTRVSQKKKRRPSARQCRQRVAQNLVDHTQRPVGSRCRRVAAKALLESDSDSDSDSSSSSSSSSDSEVEDRPTTAEDQRRCSNPTEFWLSQ